MMNRRKSKRFLTVLVVFRMPVLMSITDMLNRF